MSEQVMMRDPHEHVLDYVDDYLHDVLSPSEALAVEQHCQKCSICQAALQEARKRFDALTAMAPIEASQALVQQTMEHVRQVGTKRERNWKLLWRTVTLTAGELAEGLCFLSVDLQNNVATLEPALAGGGVSADVVEHEAVALRAAANPEEGEFGCLLLHQPDAPFFIDFIDGLTEDQFERVDAAFILLINFRLGVGGVEFV